MEGLTVELPPPTWEFATLFAAISALASILANRGASVFHDGLRPMMLGMREGTIDRGDVASSSFRLGWGFFWAFGIPFSLGFTLPLVYLIFMTTDWIGVSFGADHSRPWYRTATSLRGVTLSGVAGAVWGAVMALGVVWAARGLAALPIGMAAPLAELPDPAIQALFLFPVLTIAYQYGMRLGIVGLVVGLIAWAVGASLDQQPTTWAFVAAALVLAGLVVRGRIRVRAPVPAEEEQDLLAAWEAEAAAMDAEDEGSALFAENIARIRRSIIPIVVLSALMGAAYNLAFMTKDPITGRLFALGLVLPAVLSGLAWAFAFIPMKFTTAVVTGCMATGTFLDMAVALAMPNAWSAAAAVGALRVVEVLALGPVVSWLEHAPEIREIADTMRTAIFHVMEIGFLIGGALVAAEFAGALGITAVIALWWLNNRANSPIMPMAVGAIGAVGVGLVANLLHVLGLQF